MQAAGDFNGDGKADILLAERRRHAGDMADERHQPIGGANVGVNPGAAWQAWHRRFQWYGKADIEWQNSDGTPAVWLMDAPMWWRAAMPPIRKGTGT